MIFSTGEYWVCSEFTISGEAFKYAPSDAVDSTTPSKKDLTKHQVFFDFYSAFASRDFATLNVIYFIKQKNLNSSLYCLKYIALEQAEKIFILPQNMNKGSITKSISEILTRCSNIKIIPFAKIAAKVCWLNSLSSVFTLSLLSCFGEFLGRREVAPKFSSIAFVF